MATSDKDDYFNNNKHEDFPFYVMQFYEFAGENLKKPDERDKDNYPLKS